MPYSRRSFLKASATSLAVSAMSSSRVLGANDTLRVGCIGTGGRCRHLMTALAKVPGVRMTAVCDIYDTHLEAGKKLADAKAFATKHYQEILDRKDIDAVLIGTPDHWHVPMTVAACAAGKDVYVEKPLTHNLEEGRAVVEAAVREGPRADPRGEARQGLQGPPHLEPQPSRPRTAHAAGCRSEAG